MKSPLSRSLRRHHTARIRRNRKKFFKGLYGEYVNEEWLHRMASNPTPCSCEACGNPRRHFGRSTIAEKKADITYREELKAFNSKLWVP